MSRIQNSPFSGAVRQLDGAQRELRATQKLLSDVEKLVEAASQFSQGAQPGTCSGADPSQASGSTSSCLPPPSQDQSYAPAGAGLTKGGDFGANAVTTAGGYTIVPNGNTSWDIFEPGQKPGDKPASNISGDPHVLESDGTRWDFTKNSNFRLPDGTNIAVTTSAQQGYAVSKGLDITNGADRVKIDGVDAQPTVGDVTHDGFKARADLAHQDTYSLGGDAKDVKWFKQDADGNAQGEVVGADMTTKDGVQQYVQKTDASSQYVVDPSLQPKVGSVAWANSLRDNFVDVSNQRAGAGSDVAEATANGAQYDNDVATVRQQLQQSIQQSLQSIFQLFNFLALGRQP
jgi:hypothetical protein